MVDKKPKKKAANQEEDLSTQNLPRIYKKKCEVNGVTPCKQFMDKLNHCIEEDEDLPELHLWEEMGPVSVRAIMDALNELSYKHVKSIKLWKVNAQDEGVRTVCNFMMKMKIIDNLDLLDNGIGALGCEFIGKMLHPSLEIPLQQLVLDHNEFGTKGLDQLTAGLCQNKLLQQLSLCYCKLDEESSKYLQQILANVDSNLTELSLQGNQLKNKGIYQLFRAFKVNQVLKQVNIADNYMNLQDAETNEGMMDLIADVLKTNTTLEKYDMRFNNIGETDGQKIIECFEQNKNLCLIEVPDTLPQNIIDKIKQFNKTRKSRRGKGKGKKKKKK